MRVLLDVDELCADFVGAYLALVKEHTGTEYSRTMITDWDLKKCLSLSDSVQAAVDNDMRAPGFCEAIAVIPEAVEAVNELRKHYDVVFVTSPLDGSTTWCGERIAWLQTHFDAHLADIVLTVDKHLIKGHVLVDDKPANVQKYNSCGVGLLWNATHNQRAEGLTRITGWGELLDTLHKMDTGVARAR